MGIMIGQWNSTPTKWSYTAIPGCYALMLTREDALAELEKVFQMIAAEYSENGQALPIDTTEIVHA